MYIKSIEWMDKDAREAILTVSDGIQELISMTLNLRQELLIII